MTTLSKTRRRSTLASTVLLVAAATIFGALPAQATPAVPSGPQAPIARYVALGDSYAAGQGAGIPLDECLRSTAAYPVLLDAEPRTNLLRQAACSGATIADVASSQLSQVNRGTTLVTLTVGANDLGAGAAYAACAPDPTSGTCATALAAVQQKLYSGEIGQDLADLIAAIAQLAPNAHIVVTDYPVPFVPAVTDCTADLGITDAVNCATIGLDAQIDAAVQVAFFAGADVELASVEFAFAGHQVGDADPWLGADSSDPLAFLHPTSTGQEVYRDAVLAALAS
jgi:lysophospholipase L1-like esterase